MPAGTYHVNFNDELWIGAGTISSSIPTSNSGLTRVFSLSDASPNYERDTVEGIDYQAGTGGKRPLPASIGFNMPCTVNISLTDPAYRIIRKAVEGADQGQLLRFWRITPVKDGSSQTPEIHAGLAWASGWQPDMASAGIATASFSLLGYGLPIWYPQGGAIATVTRTSAGSGLTGSSHTGVALVGQNGPSGVGRGGTITLTVSSGAVTAQTIVAAGTNMNVGDVFTCNLADIGGTGVAPVFTVATIA